MYKVIDKRPAVLPIKPPYGRLQVMGGGRTIEQRGEVAAHAIGFTGLLIHSTKKPAILGSGHIPPDLKDQVDHYLAGKGELGGYSLDQDVGKIIGVVIYGNVYNVKDVGSNSIRHKEWIMDDCSTGDRYIEVIASVSFHEPIVHSGTAGGPSRDLSLTTTVEVSNAILDGRFTLERGTITDFDPVYIQEKRQVLSATYKDKSKRKKRKKTKT